MYLAALARGGEDDDGVRQLRGVGRVRRRLPRRGLGPLFAPFPPAARANDACMCVRQQRVGRSDYETHLGFPLPRIAGPLCPRPVYSSITACTAWLPSLPTTPSSLPAAVAVATHLAMSFRSTPTR